MQALGMDHVYQLEGGILKYLEQTDGAHWQGDCFVFDGRVAVDAKLAVATPPRTAPPLPCGARAGERGRAGGPVDAKRAPIIPPASPAPSPQSSPRRGEEANA
jgi:UPF0176 protein